MPVDAIIALGVGLVGLAFNLQAFRTGHDSLARIAVSRDKSPTAFNLETGLLTAMCLGLVVIGMQIAGWI